MIPRSERLPREGNAIHSNILAWRISWTQEPGRLQSMGSQKIRHDRATNTLTFRTESEHLYTADHGSSLTSETVDDLGSVRAENRYVY